jgi:hypothetical protein
MQYYLINGVWKDGLFNVELKTAPIQTHMEKDVPWDVSREAWKEYAAQGHGNQSHERLCERGGFAASELAILLYERIQRLEKQLGKPDER